MIDARIAAFVEMELDKYYKRLIVFVKHYEPLVAASPSPETARIIDRGSNVNTLHRAA